MGWVGGVSRFYRLELQPPREHRSSPEGAHYVVNEAEVVVMLNITTTNITTTPQKINITTTNITTTPQ